VAENGATQAAVYSAETDFRPTVAWWAVIVMMIFHATSLFQRNILALMLIEVRADLGLSDFQVSLLHGFSFSILYCFAALIFGALIDRHSVKRIAFFSVMVFSIAAATVGLARSFGGVMVARMMTGAGQGGVGPAGQVLIASLFPKNKLSFPMSLFITGGALGIGLSFVGGGLLLEALTAHSFPGLQTLAPWRQVVIVCAAPGVALAFLAFTVFEPRLAPKQPGVAAASWREFGKALLADNALGFRIVTGMTLMTMASYAIASWAPTYARRVLGMTPGEVGTEMGIIFTVVGMIASAVYGRVVDSQFSKGKTDFVIRAITFGTLGAVPLCIIGFMIDKHAGFLMALVAAQCAFVGGLSSATAAVQMITRPEMRGRMGALTIFTSGLAGYGGGSTLVSVLTDFAFGDPQKVGWSIAATILLRAPWGAWTIWSARAAFVRRVGSPKN
jgi:MFS family permease